MEKRVEDFKAKLEIKKEKVLKEKEDELKQKEHIERVKIFSKTLPVEEVKVEEEVKVVKLKQPFRARK